MKNLTLVDHPVLHLAVARLRRRETPRRAFREELHRASILLAAEAMRRVRTARVRIETPLEPAMGVEFDEEIVLVPVLRAGLTMVDAALVLAPDARAGHVGLYRDESSHHPIDYYLRLPTDLSEAHVLVLDPMLATGGSAVRAVDAVVAAGASRIQLVCVIAAPEGVRRMAEAHPDVRVVAAALDRGLDDDAFIRPGLGDAGDRAYGTGGV